MTPIVVAVLLVAVVSVQGQWGGAFLSEHNFQQQKGQNQPNQPFGGNAAGGTPGGRDMPRATKEDEYKEKWMPTGRPGFEVPDEIKKMIDAAHSAKPASKADFRASSGTGASMDPKTGTPQKQQADNSHEDDDDEEPEQDDYIPKSAPGRSDEGRRMDKCLRKVAPFCSLRIMNENFASFVYCVIDMRYRIGDDCLGWAEGHMPCAADIAQHCDRKTPSDTTECLKAGKSRMSRACVDSQFYVAMEQGFQEFREGMAKGMEGQHRQQQQGPKHYSGPLDDDTSKSAPRQGPRAPGQQQQARENDGKKTPSTVRIVPKSVVGDRDEL